MRMSTWWGEETHKIKDGIGAWIAWNWDCKEVRVIVNKGISTKINIKGVNLH